MKWLSRSLLRALAISFVTLSGTAGGQSPKVASIPIEIAGQNYLLVKARVNGSEPLTFLLDSGGGSGLVLYFEAARALRVNFQGKGKGGGGGNATFATTSIRKASLQFPGVEISAQTFVVYPPDRKAVVGDRIIDGVIGYTLFNRYVVEIDYQSQVVNLYEPRSYQYSGPGESIPIRILSRLPFVRVKVPVAERKPLEGDFIVDTGAGRFAVILNTAFVEANRLLEATQRTVRDPGAEGVGGEVKLLVGRLPTVQVGSFTLSDPVLHFAQDRKGAFGSSEFSGVIGGELLRRFKVIFDYSRKRMILESNARLADPFEYDMSGIRVSPVGAQLKTLRVSQVIEGSPATEAGVREGDVISAIDGAPTAELSLFQIIQKFKREGKEYLLDIVRGEEKKQLRLKLRRLI
jgi:hypothetical protein